MRGTPLDRVPLLAALIKALPPERTIWPAEARVKWLQMAAVIFDVVYAGNDERAAIIIRSDREPIDS